ncbi:MAG TPA: hypothetical protein VGO37_09040 [Steroidobacteraceae bacterium]|jgi:hypothetical protein|nr:hypothetical protein [Steroidobacteraceae bacterium]
MDPPDDLDNYLRGDSALSRQYKRESAPIPPHALDRRVLEFSREAYGKPPCLAPLAFAASVLLSVALVLAILFGPQSAKRVDNAPHLVRVAAHANASTNAPLNRKLELYSSDPRLARAPAVWLADIAALRRAGRNAEADAELRRFRSAYAGYCNRRACD